MQQGMKAQSANTQLGTQAHTAIIISYVSSGILEHNNSTHRQRHHNTPALCAHSFVYCVKLHMTGSCALCGVESKICTGLRSQALLCARRRSCT